MPSGLFIIFLPCFLLECNKVCLFGMKGHVTTPSSGYLPCYGPFKDDLVGFAPFMASVSTLRSLVRSFCGGEYSEM